MESLGVVIGGICTGWRDGQAARDEADRRRINRIEKIEALMQDLAAERDRLQAERTDR
jgi:hypothetical protein